jgi:hypothetical protein
MQTPKGLAKTLVDRARARPALRLQVERYPQVPGTISRSAEVLFPMENTYRNLSFAPYWYFGGFREVALGAMFYHQVLAPFRLAGAFEDFLSAPAGRLTVEQIRLRSLQDEVRPISSTSSPPGVCRSSSSRTSPRAVGSMSTRTGEAPGSGCRCRTSGRRPPGCPNPTF